ncbi:MAG: hypothetical protein WBE68_16690 [Candidatus Nitrosopolaris sp.]
MNGKDRVDISKSSKKTETNQQSAFRHIASEGSVVVLDARDIIDDVDTSSITNYSWKPPTDMHLDIYDGIKDNPVISFTAPYVKGDTSVTKLRMLYQKASYYRLSGQTNYVRIGLGENILI